MTRISRMPVLVALIAVMLAVPSFAAGQKRRAVSHPSNNLASVEVKGTVLDDTNGRPVKGVDVTSGNVQILTDAAGRFQLSLKSGGAVPLKLSRSGYVTKELTVAPGSDTAIRLTPRPTVRVRMVSGLEHTVDTESVQFAFAATMSGFPMQEYPRLCANGEEFQPPRATLARIQGPATSVNDPACCSRGPVLRLNVTLKSGQTVDARFADSCFGYEPIFVARDHSTADFHYLKFTEIAEVVFP